MRQIWIKSILKIRSVSSIIHIVKNQNTSRLTKREILRKCCSSTISRFFVCTEKEIGNGFFQRLLRHGSLRLFSQYCAAFSNCSCVIKNHLLKKVIAHGKDGIKLFVGAGTQRGPCAKRFSLDSRGGAFLSLLVFSPRTALIALLTAAVSLGFLLLISRYSAQNAPVEAQANRDMTGTVQRAEDLLRKVERVVFALLVGQARIKSKIFRRQGIFLCQRAGGS